LGIIKFPIANPYHLIVPDQKVTTNAVCVVVEC